MHKNYILMVFEGQRTEPLIVNNLKKYFLNKADNTIIKAVYGTVIYKLYKEFFKNDELDEDVELFPIIKESIQKNTEFNNITRNQVSEIYLFFDYDGHATNACDNKLHNMLELFNNETENGKLYISYPMTEAIKHLNKSTDFKTVVAKSNRQYKKLVSKSCNENFKDLSNLSKENWSTIINEHCKKANFIVNNEYIFSNDIIEQLTIFIKQKEKYIDINSIVAVLSAFPIFLADYYGYNNLKTYVE